MSCRWRGKAKEKEKDGQPQEKVESRTNVTNIAELNLLEEKEFEQESIQRGRRRLVVVGFVGGGCWSERF